MKAFTENVEIFKAATHCFVTESAFSPNS